MMARGSGSIYESPTAARLMVVAAIAMSAAAINLAGCGDDKEPERARSSDPKIAIDQALRRTKDIKTGRQNGSVVVGSSGPVKLTVDVRFGGPFDMTKISQPAYSYSVAFENDANASKQLGFAAAGSLRYVTVGDKSYSHRYGSARGAHTPFGVLAREISGRLENPKLTNESDARGIRLYTARIEPSVFRGSLVAIFNDLVQPGARSMAIGGGGTEQAFERSIQEARAMLWINDKGLLQSIRLVTDGRLAQGGSIERIRLQITVSVSDQNKPVEISLPSSATELGSSNAFDRKIAGFMRGQIERGHIFR